MIAWFLLWLQPSSLIPLAALGLAILGYVRYMRKRKKEELLKEQIAVAKSVAGAYFGAYMTARDALAPWRGNTSERVRDLARLNRGLRPRLLASCIDASLLTPSLGTQAAAVQSAFDFFVMQSAFQKAPDKDAFKTVEQSYNALYQAVATFLCNEGVHPGKVPAALLPAFLPVRNPEPMKPTENEAAAQTDETLEVQHAATEAVRAKRELA